MSEKLEKMALTSVNIIDERIESMRKIFPEVFSQGRIDYDALQRSLGNWIEPDKERFGLIWPGKAECMKNIQQSSVGALLPVRQESINFDSTQNLIVEGDNLEVLKLLQKSYYGKVKMIYIDPPYNTGNDFIYPDDFREGLQDYLKFSKQVDDSGYKLSTNTETDGRYHTRWLNMMYKRLFFARNLLSEDGVIFVSISDHELHNLRSMMNDIFGEENYVNTVCVKAKPSAGASGGGEDKKLKKNVEFLLVFVRSRDSESSLNLEQAYEEKNLVEHIQNMKDEDKSWKYTRVITSFGERSQVAVTKDGDGNEIKIFKHTDYKITPIGELVKNGASEMDVYLKYFDTVFRDTNAQSSIRTRVMEALGESDGLYSIEYVPRSGRNKGKISTVYYKGQKKDQIAWLKDIAIKKEKEIIIREKVGTLWDGFNWNNVSKEGDVIFPNGKKPIDFIKRMIQLATKPNEDNIVMDFFAGSGSTGHAVLSQNQDDSGNRQFILVQIPEPIASSNSRERISQICLQRMRHVAEKINSDKALDLIKDKNIPVGFRFFTLDKSSFLAWQGKIEDGSNLSRTLELFVNNVDENRSAEDILYEVLLKAGYLLTSSIDKLVLGDKDVYSICDGALLICLDRELTLPTIEAMVDRSPVMIICIDEGFKGNDQLKVNTVQTIKSHNQNTESSIVFRVV